ncbi:TrmH family RNA methyltransferase [Senegalimassilia faecalis]|uniref:TrmH family RNA methyltransferase n=1 Tax=Senegalimassilia faecalis TaxID=2509433 RepID=UPI003A9878EF
MAYEHVTSANDARLAPYARVRDADLAAWPASPAGLFMAESRAVIAAAIDAGAPPHSFLVSESWADDAAPLAAALQAKWPACPTMRVPDQLFTQVTGYKIVRGPVVAFERPALADPAVLLAGARRVAVLEDVGNYANIGSAFRAARAFGIDAVLVTPSCHDPLFRRASRASQGTVLQVPWTRIGTQRQWAAEGIPLLHAAGFKVAALALEDRSLALGDPRLAACERLAMVLGTEGAGLFPSTIAASDYTVKIPMTHGVDSLNVAAASAVAFWELRLR